MITAPLSGLFGRVPPSFRPARRSPGRSASTPRRWRRSSPGLPHSPPTSRPARHGHSSKLSSFRTKSCPPPGRASSPATTSRSSRAREREPPASACRSTASRTTSSKSIPPIRPLALPDGFRFARTTPAGLVEYPDRGGDRGGLPRRPRPGACLARRPDRGVLHPHPGRGAHRACRRRNHAGDLRGEERPPLHADRARAHRARGARTRQRHHGRASRPGSPPTGGRAPR